MQTVFDKFGGTRPMAAHLNEAPSTVNGWKSERRIPATKQPAVLAKAEELGLPVTAEDVVFPMGRVAACSRCSVRVEDPRTLSCTSVHCPLADRVAA